MIDAYDEGTQDLYAMLIEQGEMPALSASVIDLRSAIDPCAEHGHEQPVSEPAKDASHGVIDLSAAIDAKAESIAAAVKVIDAALLSCKENPGVLFSAESIAAYRMIVNDKSLWAEYRVKIKQAKPSGISLADIDKVATIASESDAAGKDSTASELIELVISRGELFYDDRDDKAYYTTDIDGVNHTQAIDSRAFVNWVSFAYYSNSKQSGAMGKSASESSIKNARFALSGIAKHEGFKQRVHLRVADHGGGHYLFIADERLQVIEVLSTGWRIVEKSPVKFWKPASMQSLPIPQAAGNLSLLWEFINIPEHVRLLVLAWMLEAFRAETPSPIMALCGTQGCAKSSTQDKIRQLIDPSAVNLRSAPKSTEDIYISAGSNRVISLENISHLTSKLQDTLCTVATGGGHAARTLYTNDEETIIEAKRPVIINSIPNVVTAQDLTDRAICIELPRIEYREESELNMAWEAVKPSIFGGLLDLFVKTLERLPAVKLINPPRMADFTRLGEAMAQALGYPAGTFDALYKLNRSESVAAALESSPIGVAIREMVDNYQGSSNVVFYGTCKALYEALSEDYRNSVESWPRSPRGLSEALKRQTPALHSLGIEIIQSSQRETTATGRGLTVKITKSGQVSKAAQDSGGMHHCRDCQMMINGRCSVDKSRPVDDIPRRCADFVTQVTS
ncbi:MAG: hypothetical protein ABL919_08555 [Methylococcales bacterium]|nr:hypothetical protein [Methylococcaceae bacterium]